MQHLQSVTVVTFAVAKTQKIVKKAHNMADDSNVPLEQLVATPSTIQIQSTEELKKQQQDKNEAAKAELAKLAKDAKTTRFNDHKIWKKLK